MLELMIVLAIAALLAAMAAPGLKDTLERNARESAMQDIVSAIGNTRSEAVTQGRTVTICRSTNQTSCAASTGGDWNAGWIIFTDAGTAGVLDGTDALVRVHGASNGQSVIKLETRANGYFTGDFLQFNSNGFLSNTTAATGAGAYFKFCAQDNVATKTRAILMSATGRPTLAPAVAAGATQKDLTGVALVCP